MKNLQEFIFNYPTFPYGLLGESRSHRESIHPASLAGPCWRARSPVQPRTPLTIQSQILETAFIIHHFPDLYRFCIINSCSSKWAEVFWQIALLLLHVNARAAECVEGFILCDGVRGGWGVEGCLLGGSPPFVSEETNSDCAAIVQVTRCSVDKQQRLESERHANSWRRHKSVWENIQHKSR